MKNELAKLKHVIDSKLNTLLDKKILDAKNISPESVFIFESIKRFISNGGKRLRPILIYHGYIGSGGKDTKLALDFAPAIELVHNFLLIHDDIIDEGDLRRNRPTLHRDLETHFKKIESKDCAHLGISEALVAGDLVSNWGYELVTNLEIESDLKLKLLKSLNDIVLDVEYGELLDVVLETKTDWNEEEILRMYTAKSSSYTISGPLTLGANLANAPSKILHQINTFSTPLGQAFQIKDDLLGIFTSHTKVGKSVKSDFEQGKRTFLLARTFKLCTKKDRDFILSKIGKESLSNTDFEKIKKIIVSSGAKDEIEDKINKLCKEAKELIKKSGFNLESKKFLLYFSDYLVTRNY